MENIHKLIVLAAGLILTCIVILAGITLTGTGEQITKSMSNAITTMYKFTPARQEPLL